MKKDFIFGVSASAFQIEGDDGKQGRGVSVWDSFCKKKDIRPRTMGNILCVK